jgi:hypothetical protein
MMEMQDDKLQHQQPEEGWQKKKKKKSWKKQQLSVLPYKKEMGEQDVVTVTQVREDEEEPDDFKKDRGDEDTDYGIVVPLTDAKCRRIATVSVEDEELEALTPIAVISEFKDRGGSSALGGDEASGSQGAGSSTNSERNRGLRFCKRS